MMRKIVVCAVLCGLLAMAGCGGGASNTGGAPASDTLIVGKPGDAVKLDPQDITDGESAQITDLIFDTLVQYKDGSTEIEPGLAQSWDHSSGGIVWTFHLRPGVRFHDGTPCDAAAVKFSFEREMLPTHPGGFDGKFAYWPSRWGGYPGNILKVEAVNPQTVRFTLKTPSAPFLSNLAMFCMAVVSPAAVQKYGADFFKHPVGTGPYKFVSWDPKQKVVLEANPDYWGGAPAIRNLIFLPIENNTTRRLQLEQGAVQFITNPMPEDVALLRGNGDVVVADQPGMNVCYLAMNENRHPFDNRTVRLAIAAAVNKEAIVKQLYQGLAVVATNPMPPVIWGFNDQVTSPPYDPEGAKKMLAAAGFPAGFKTTLWYPSVPRPYLQQPKEVAEALQANLKAAGIDAELMTYDWATFLTKTQNGEHDLVLFGWIGDNGDPDNFLYMLLDPDNAKPKISQNLAFYRSPAVHALLVRAQQVMDQPARADLYKQAQALIAADAPWVPLAYANQVAAYRKGLQGFQLHPTGSLRLNKVHW